MSAPIVVFFNNKGGVGKTSLVYHLAWMYADLGRTVLAADVDPQANLTAGFLNEDELEELWDLGGEPRTIFDAVAPLMRGVGDIVLPPPTASLDERIFLLPGDLSLARFEDELSSAWPSSMDGSERAFRVMTAFWRLLKSAAETNGADVVLVDLGPNLGAINRAGLVAADHLVVPLAPDLFSLQGLKNLGPMVRDEWRPGWKRRLEQAPAGLELPRGSMDPVGYVVLQHAVRLDRPVRAYERWVQRIPEVYSEFILGKPLEEGISFGTDPDCLALLKHYRSLMPLAQEARKPMFHLTAADGAIGAHQTAVTGVERDFKALADAIASRIGVDSRDALISRESL